MQLHILSPSQSHSRFLSLNHNTSSLPLSSNPSPSQFLSTNSRTFDAFSSSFSKIPRDVKLASIATTHRVSALSNNVRAVDLGFDSSELDLFAEVGNMMADAAGEVIRKYFRKSFDILDKEDFTPVTIADQAAEESMVKIIQENLPSHAIYGEENGWRCKEKFANYVWVLDPIDGTKSFVTGKPLFGTLIALLYKGKPILGIIDQPVMKERWIGLRGRRTTLNVQEVSTRSCAELSQAYLDTSSPHLFSREAELAFARVRDKVKLPLYGCACYAYALLASGFVDLVIESDLKPYDFFALVPVIEGAGGIITDWQGHQLHWEASADSHAPSFNVVAAGDKMVHQQALDALQWN